MQLMRSLILCASLLFAQHALAEDWTYFSNSTDNTDFYYDLDSLELDELGDYTLHVAAIYDEWRYLDDGVTSYNSSIEHWKLDCSNNMVRVDDEFYWSDDEIVGENLGEGDWEVINEETIADDLRQELCGI
ncbi:surface-adhesin E family protein [Moraxella nasicaprae]|uniref:Surface-adhesin protein E-like domain-containing protein n=1 Tax=Moraxella nasicaprae TaxID=2904122 RepID=A0ABY6F3Y3_9GAMM|nr:surface-adhesin E family protein [Moraxella nasicaprae]UXZ04744.1 hypothetical protein LU297_09310 [Moraxella nasicaprae]